MKPFHLLACGLLALPLGAAALPDPAWLGNLGRLEWHVGAARAEGDPVGRFTWGVALPLPLRGPWSLRPRFDATTFEPAGVVVRQRHFGVELVRNLGPDRWPANGILPYVAAGAGILITTRAASPGTPRSETAGAPAASLALGCRLHPALAVEARFQASRHVLAGQTLQDRTLALTAHVRPMALFE